MKVRELDDCRLPSSGSEDLEMKKLLSEAIHLDERERTAISKVRLSEIIEGILNINGVEPVPKELVVDARKFHRKPTVFEPFWEASFQAWVINAVVLQTHLAVLLLQEQ